MTEQKEYNESLRSATDNGIDDSVGDAKRSDNMSVTSDAGMDMDIISDEAIADSTSGVKKGTRMFSET